VRAYTVQPGDTPSSIAARDDMAGCPKCARDLVEANAHRASVRHTNGYLSFAEPLVVGEQLWLPDKWFDGSLDRLPRSYFDDLPKVPAGLGELPPERTEMNNDQQRSGNVPAYALAARPAFGLAGCGVPYGQPYGPYGLQYGLAQATPAAAAPAAAAPAAAPASGFGGFLSNLPSWWPYATLAAGGVLALTGIILMATKK
jgi:hypothetical protein